MSEAPDRASDTAGRKSKAWVPVTVILVAVGLMAFVFNSRFGQDPRLVDSPLIGKPLPELTLDYLEQEGSLTLSDLEGQVLVLNFWASWCIPCRYEHPALTRAATSYEGRGVHFVGILYQDRKGPAVAFLDEFGRGDNYSYVDDPDSRATVELGVFGVPETYFVDAQGIVRGKVQGQITEVVLVDALESILAGRALDL